MVTFIAGIWLLLNLVAFICIVVDALIFHLPVFNPIDDIQAAMWYRTLAGYILALECILLFPALCLAYIVLKILR